MIELDDADSPSTSRVAPFGTFANPVPYTEVTDFSGEVESSGTGKVKVKLTNRDEHHQDVPPRPQTARHKDRMDAGKQALRELLKDRKTKKSKKTSCVNLIRLYLTIISALMIIGGLLVLIFLVPMTIDPALATLNYDIDYDPSICLTLYVNEVRRGDDNMWCSCTEGCTRDIFVCQQIYVAYRKSFFSLDERLQVNFNKTAYYSKMGKKATNFVDEVDENRLSRPTNHDCQNVNWIYNPSCWDTLNASLYVNVKGCGYPPHVECETFMASYNKTGRRFLCFYSKLDPNIVIINYDPKEPWNLIVQSLAWTFGAQAIGITVIFLLHCPIKSTLKSMCQKKEKVKTMKSKTKNWKDKVRSTAFQRDWYDVHT